MDEIQHCLDCKESESFPLDEIKKLDALYFEPVWSPRQWSLLNHANHRLLCFWCGAKEVQSYILGEINSADKSFEIFKVITTPAFRRKGVATKLFKELLKFSKDLRFEKVYLQVASHNHAAIRAYQSWGFKETRVIKNYYGQGLDGIEFLYQIPIEHS